MAQQLTYHHRLSYNTVSDRTRLSRTPDSRIVSLYTKKVRKAPKCVCGISLGRHQGVRAVRPHLPMRSSQMNKQASRADGGPMSAKCVRDGIKRAFFTEEQKLFVRLLPAQAQARRTGLRQTEDAGRPRGHDSWFCPLASPGRSCFIQGCPASWRRPLEDVTCGTHHPRYAITPHVIITEPFVNGC
ncbi:60S ribosomal protein L34-like [Ursus arctos]|uniref:60S ribosomal protein L34-like n=1 Tax=Ursus arctos TaxID=9644 RepID=UPI002547088B|nr:60S ribosomal protein L34-like [Ursus arctos]